MFSHPTSSFFLMFFSLLVSFLFSFVCVLLYIAVVVVVVNIWLMNSYTHFELVQINTPKQKCFSSSHYKYNPYY